MRAKYLQIYVRVLIRIKRRRRYWMQRLFWSPRPPHQLYISLPPSFHARKHHHSTLYRGTSRENTFVCFMQTGKSRQMLSNTGLFDVHTFCVYGWITYNFTECRNMKPNDINQAEFLHYAGLPQLPSDFNMGRLMLAEFRIDGVWCCQDHVPLGVSWSWWGP